MGSGNNETDYQNKQTSLHVSQTNCTLKINKQIFMFPKQIGIKDCILPIRVVPQFICIVDGMKKKKTIGVYKNN